MSRTLGRGKKKAESSYSDAQFGLPLGRNNHDFANPIASLGTSHGY
jgi:hypothetical protein